MRAARLKAKHNLAELVFGYRFTFAELAYLVVLAEYAVEIAARKEYCA
jgi:hypothetical protein